MPFGDADAARAGTDTAPEQYSSRRERFWQEFRQYKYVEGAAGVHSGSAPILVISRAGVASSRVQH